MNPASRKCSMSEKCRKKIAVARFGIKGRVLVWRYFNAFERV